MGICERTFREILEFYQVPWGPWAHMGPQGPHGATVDTMDTTDMTMSLGVLSYITKVGHSAAAAIGLQASEGVDPLLQQQPVNWLREGGSPPPPQQLVMPLGGVGPPRCSSMNTQRSAPAPKQQ